MEIFNKLFRRKPDTRHTVSPPPTNTIEAPKAEQIKPPEFTPHRLAGEIKLPPRENPESHEQPRIIELKQIRWGKITQTPNGPIVPGSEHMCVGRSESIPNGLNSWINPSKLFETNDRTSYDQYPWLKEDGGIVKRTVDIEGIPYVICARLNAHTEGGQDKPNSRKFSQMHMITMPAAEWSVAVVPQLADMLDTTPPTATNYNLKKLECSTDILDTPLPADWFDTSVKDWVKAVLSGQAANVQDWKSPVKDALEKMYYALLCLPESVAREISFGAGLHTMTDSCRMGLGMVAVAKVRKIGQNWKYENGASTKLGDEYLIELEQRLTSCVTPRQVLQAVETMPLTLVQRVEQALFGREN